MSDKDWEKHERKEEEHPPPPVPKAQQPPSQEQASKKSKKKKNKKKNQKQPQKVEHIQGDSVLHYTVLAGQKENVEKLLTHGMRVQHQSSADGATPLHRAAQTGNIDIAEVLINRGADLNAPNYLMQTSLHVALENNHTEFAKFLITKGARRKCKHNCVRCQTFSNSQQKHKQDQQNKKFRNRRHNKYEGQNVQNAQNVENNAQVTQEQIQDHLVLESEHQGVTIEPSNASVELELICRDLENVSIGNLVNSAGQGAEESSNDDDSVGNLDLSDEIRKEKKALGGPMFSREENEKLRREKMRGGDFKEKSSESSNGGGSDPPSPNRAEEQNFNVGNPRLTPEEIKKQRAMAQNKRRENKDRKN